MMEVNCCLAAKQRLISTMQKFYLCTHLPIKAFSKKGDLLAVEGYTEKYELFFQKTKIIQQTLQSLHTENSISSLIFSIDGAQFTVFSLCPKTVDHGFYMIGPYTTSLDESERFPYKPQDCMPHLLSLLRNIGQSIHLDSLVNGDSPGLYVRKALDCIHTYFYEPLTVDCIATNLKISKCYFCSIFKKETGKTFTQVLNEVRIEKSKGLLIESQQSILDIAIAVGYNNQNYYTMIFKKLNHMTPHHFRQIHGFLGE